jgi:hypothetical protein
MELKVLLCLWFSAVVVAGDCPGSLQINTCFESEGHTFETLKNLTSAVECCAACGTVEKCKSFTMNFHSMVCSLKKESVSKGKTGNCTSANLPQGPPTPAPPTPPPTPPTPASPTPPPSPPPLGKQPHFVTILADDLGWWDTSIHNPDSPTPTISNLTKEGYRLDRHYVWRYCRCV